MVCSPSRRRWGAAVVIVLTGILGVVFIPSLVAALTSTICASSAASDVELSLRWSGWWSFYVFKHNISMFS